MRACVCACVGMCANVVRRSIIDESEVKPNVMKTKIQSI